MPPRMMFLLLRCDDPTTNHFGGHRMVLRQLLELFARIQITPTIACMSHKKPPVDGESQREGRAHASPLWVRRGFLKNASISLKKGVLQITQDILLLTGLQIGKPLERVQQKLLDALDG